MFIKKICYKVYLIMWNACYTIYNLSMWIISDMWLYIIHRGLQSINTYSSVSHLPLFSDSVYHIVTHYDPWNNDKWKEKKMLH